MSRRDRNDAPMNFFSFLDIITSVIGIMVIVLMLLSLDLVNRRESKGSAAVGKADDADFQRVLRDLRQQRDDLLRLVNEGKVTLASLSGAAVVTPEQLRALADKVIQLEGNLKAVSDQIARGEQPASNAEALVERLRSDIDERQRELAKTDARAQAMARLPDLPVPPRVPRGAEAAVEKAPIYVECDAVKLTAGRITLDKGAEVLKRFDGAGVRQALMQWAAGRAPDAEYFVLLVRPEGVAHFRPLVADLESRGFEVGWGVCVPEFRPFDSTPVRAQP